MRCKNLRFPLAKKWESLLVVFRRMPFLDRFNLAGSSEYLDSQSMSEDLVKDVIDERQFTNCPVTVSSPECSLEDVFFSNSQLVIPRPSDRSLNKYSTLAAGRIGHRSLGVGNGSSLTGAPQGEELGLMKPLSVQHQVPKYDSKIPLVEWEEYRQVLREKLQEIPEQRLLSRLQVASPLDLSRPCGGGYLLRILDILLLNYS
ncbi:hypothetical protein Tco_0743689 [Tanacetum coccineum]